MKLEDNEMQGPPRERLHADDATTKSVHLIHLTVGEDVGGSHRQGARTACPTNDSTPANFLPASFGPLLGPVWAREETCHSTP